MVFIRINQKVKCFHTAVDICHLEDSITFFSRQGRLNIRIIVSKRAQDIIFSLDSDELSILKVVGYLRFPLRKLYLQRLIFDIGRCLLFRSVCHSCRIK